MEPGTPSRIIFSNHIAWHIDFDAMVLRSSPKVGGELNPHLLEHRILSCGLNASGKGLGERTGECGTRDIGRSQLLKQRSNQNLSFEKSTVRYHIYLRTSRAVQLLDKLGL